MKVRLRIAGVITVGLVILLWLFGRCGDDERDGAPDEDREGEVTAPASSTTPAASGGRERPALPPAPVRLAPAEVDHDDAAATGRFEGRVVNWGTGEPVVGAELVFSGDGGAAASVTSDEDGAFSFTPDALGTFRLAVASADGFLPYAPEWGHSPIELTARAGVVVRGIVVYLTPAIDYRGRVVRAGSGEPVAGARIHVHDPRGERELMPDDGDLVSDADGRFVFHAPDFAMITASHDEHGTGVAVLDGDAQVTHELEVEIEPGGPRVAIPETPADPDGEPEESGAAIAGRVVSDGGEPVGAFTVAVLVREGVAERVVASTSVFDGGGAFRLGGLEPGPYVVRAAAYGYPPSDAVAAVAAAEPDPVTVTMPRGGTLTGRVIDAETREGLARAKVSVEGSMGGGTSALPTTSVAVTGEDGRFALAGLPPGRASVVVAAFEHHTRIVGGFEVEPGAELGPIEVALTPLAEGEEPRIELAGIGAQLGADGNALVIQRLIEGGGAAEAGLAVGDRITGIEGTSVGELGFQGAIQRIRGPEGTPVQLTVRRTDGSVEEITAYRRKIRA